jgi:hypothetical protein
MLIIFKERKFMSHLVETMAYAGEVPWHGLGKQVSDNMSPSDYHLVEKTMYLFKTQK